MTKYYYVSYTYTANQGSSFGFGGFVTSIDGAGLWPAATRQKAFEELAKPHGWDSLTILAWNEISQQAHEDFVQCSKSTPG